VCHAVSFALQSFLRKRFHHGTGPNRSVNAYRPLSGRSQFKRLITDLLGESSRFAGRWAEHDIAVRRADRTTIRHPDVGAITVDCDVLRTDGSGLTIIVYTAAPGSPDEALLDLGRVIGLRRLAS
jgi:hypothetical protein